MKNTIDLMEKTCPQNNIGHHIPESSNKKTKEKPSETRGNGHALVSLHSKPQ